MMRAEPRAYQSRIVNKTINMFMGRHHNGRGEPQPACRSVLIESPTGSGKTCMALMAVRQLQLELGDEELVVAWVAMRRNLLVQAEEENRTLELGAENVHFVSMFDRRPEAVMAAREGRRLIAVIDEAQHDAAETMSHMHNLLRPDYVLGLTATPFRTDRLKLCFEGVVKDAGIHQLIQEGWLSPYDHYTIPDWSPATVADHWLADRDRWGKSIFYFLTIAECAELVGRLRGAGVAAELVTGDSDREAQLAAFRDGAVPALVNCMVLSEGFNCPSMKTAWLRPSSKGPSIQMGGRVLRRHPALPVKQIVQCRRTEHPFMKTAMPVQQLLWDQGSRTWLTLKVNRHLGAIQSNALTHIATAEVELPACLVEKRAKRSRRWRPE